MQQFSFTKKQKKKHGVSLVVVSRDEFLSFSWRSRAADVESLSYCCRAGMSKQRIESYEYGLLTWKGLLGVESWKL